ncbi:DUF5681 domain-containing protein [Sphingomonas sp.]|uniref:DUF5681 domain-containing protein n=1 Tax=Sphingomonas sp. TaxID=28214 RepID=UPI001832A6D6|nr:DUF5681 domain-containing protein [Sphingomonas sp.]MBA3512328.1 hypothetical protein [Sphingomonas sp.]
MANRPKRPRNGDYEVGYGKPPKQYQFKPGQSGNPKGREKGSRGLKTDLTAELEARMTIRINNEPVSDTRQRLLLRALASRAAAGDVRAASIVIPLIIQVLGIEDRGTDRNKLSQLDQSILDEMLRSLGVEDNEPAASIGDEADLGRSDGEDGKDSDDA